MIPFAWKQSHIECPYGRIGPLKIENFGVNKNTLRIRDACRVNETLYDNKECSDFLDKSTWINWWDTHCKDKKVCSFNLKAYVQLE